MCPSFLLITTDQHQAGGLGCYGNPSVLTPHLDRLAAEGVRLTRTYVNHPLCMPSRATLLTGRYPRAHREVPQRLLERLLQELVRTEHRTPPAESYA
jgi:arylsulfatase A-like enzyme